MSGFAGVGALHLEERDPQFSGAWRYHMIWIQEGAKVWRKQEGNPFSPLHAQGPPAKSA